MRKREVANFLQLSTRAVERAVSLGKLTVTYERDRHGYAAIFDPAAVRRYKEQIEPLPRAWRAPKRPADVTSNPPEGQPPFVIGHATPLAEMPAVGAEPTVPISSRLTLSLEEAAALSGLRADSLDRAIRDKRLKAFELDGSARVKRADLDAFVDSL